MWSSCQSGRKRRRRPPPPDAGSGIPRDASIRRMAAEKPQAASTPTPGCRGPYQSGPPRARAYIHGGTVEGRSRGRVRGAATDADEEHEKGLLAPRCPPQGGGLQPSGQLPIHSCPRWRYPRDGSPTWRGAEAATGPRKADDRDARRHQADNRSTARLALL